MDPFIAYQQYNSLRLHFTTESYDYLKYGGKTKNTATVAAHRKFLANKQKMLYTQLSRQSDSEGLVLSNLLHNPKAFIADIVSSDGQDIYTAWKTRQARLMFQLETELSANDNWRKMVAFSDNGLPHIISEYIAGRISPETVAIIDSFAKRLDDWAKLDHPLMNNVQLRLRKYRPFVRFDKTRAKAVIGKLVGAK